MSHPPTVPPPPTQPKLLDRVRAAIRAKHYSRRTEEACVRWIVKFILFHNKRHPMEMGEEEIGAFPSHLAVSENVAASTRNQALCAIVFLYKHVLEKNVGELEGLVWAKRPARLPEVFTAQEVDNVLSNLDDLFLLMASLMCGGGLRLPECLRPRVKDIDFASAKITVVFETAKHPSVGISFTFRGLEDAFIQRARLCRIPWTSIRLKHN